MYVNSPYELSATKFKTEQENQLMNSFDGSKLPNESDTLSYWAVKILKTADPKEKCDLTFKVAERWKNGEIEIGYAQPPEVPERKDTLNIIDPSKIKRGKGGTLVIFFFSKYIPFINICNIISINTILGKSYCLDSFFSKYRTMGY